MFLICKLISSSNVKRRSWQEAIQSVLCWAVRIALSKLPFGQILNHILEHFRKIFGL